MASRYCLHPSVYPKLSSTVAGSKYQLCITFSLYSHCSMESVLDVHTCILNNFLIFTCTFCPNTPVISNTIALSSIPYTISQGIVDAYQHAVRNVQLHGPTNFSSILDKAMQYASVQESQQSQNYFILLIITVSVHLWCPKNICVHLCTYVHTYVCYVCVHVRLGVMKAKIDHSFPAPHHKLTCICA